MNKLFSISALAAAAVLAVAGSATAADMPVKAPPPPPPPVYDWSGLYVGFHSGYLTGTVQDNLASGAFNAERDVNNWIAGFHVGLQREFTGIFGFGGLVLGVEGGLNAPLSNNDRNNFGACGVVATSICGVQNFHDNWYAGGRLGLAWNWGNAGSGLLGWFGGDYLFTVSGGWTSAVFQRNDILLATGAVCSSTVPPALGSCTNDRHDGAYVGLGLDHVWAKGVLVDWVSGIDWQHQFFDNQTDVDVLGVGHTLSADVDIIRLRTTLKFK